MNIPLVSPDDQKVTFVELFFDLVFVFCVTQVVTLLHGHIDVRSAGAALLVFWLIWWGWTQFTWALNAANTEHPRVQLTIMLATAIAFILAVGIPRALGDGALWFAGAYVALRSVGLLVYHWVTWRDALQRRAVIVFSLFSAAGLAAVLIGAIAGGQAQYIWWAIAIVLDLIAAGIGGRREGWNLHPEHFCERHGLIVIIALGETLIVAASGLVEAPTPLAMITGLLAVGVTGGLWWSYFAQTKQALEHAMASRVGTARSRLARDVFSVLHFPMLYGVILLAAATELALTHPEQPLEAGARAALGGGALLFVVGAAAALARANGRVEGWRAGLSVAGAGVVLAAGSFAAVGMAILLAFLVLLGVVEYRRGISRHSPGGTRTVEMT
jgi:low temperature requirement protein LtrA